mgnify:CR=1 FL=1
MSALPAGAQAIPAAARRRRDLRPAVDERERRVGMKDEKWQFYPQIL